MEVIEKARDRALVLELAIEGALAREILDGGLLGSALLREAGELADLLCGEVEKSTSVTI